VETLPSGSSAKVAPVDLADVVRENLPPPGGSRQWRVEIANVGEEANANPKKALVRVERSWKQSIYERGLQHVMRRYPLSLQRVTGHPGVSLWRSVAIEQVYWQGQFTGQLAAGPTFIAQTNDRSSASAAIDGRQAIKLVLTQARGKRLRKAAEQRKRLLLQRGFRALFEARATSRDRHDGKHCVPLEPYRKWFSSQLIDAWEYHGAGGVPLIAIELETVEAMLDLDLKQVADLMYQLDLDIDAVMATENSMMRVERVTLTAEESACLDHIASL
jgi:hypothetical protein